MEQFDKVTASLRPKRIDDLRDGVDIWVGRTLTWQASYVIEDGQFQGEWAMSPVLDASAERPPFAWVPLSDLDDVMSSR